MGQTSMYISIGKKLESYMQIVKNSMYEIGLLLENYLEKEMTDSLGHRVYEITLLLHEHRDA